MRKNNLIPAVALSVMCLSLCGCAGTNGNIKSPTNTTPSVATDSVDTESDESYTSDTSIPDFAMSEQESPSDPYSENGSITFQDDSGNKYSAVYESNIPLKMDSNTSLVSKTSNTIVYFDADAEHAENSMELFKEMAKENVQSDSSHVSTKEGQTDVGDSYYMERTVNEEGTVYTYKISILDKTESENPVLYEVTFDTYGENKKSVEASPSDVQDFVNSLIFLAQQAK